ncbi:MAG: hypothetical protein INR71_02875 [Terriglobus roseus]|nr:hypothetical protein [Terriglobus roseus]
MASPQARPKARPYRDFLTPFLHRRFAAASAWSLAGSFLLAAWMSCRNGFWAFLFMSVLRTFVLFICALLVFIMRVGNLHGRVLFVTATHVYKD